MSRLDKEKVYFVRHPVHGLAIVTAQSEEEATVAASRFYGVPWGKIAWQCVIERTMPIFNNICTRCGGMFQGGHAEGTSLCDKCLQKLRDENAEQQRMERRRRMAREMAKKYPRKKRGVKEGTAV